MTRKTGKILFVTMPHEGEVQDRVTSRFFKNPVVKYMPLGVLSVAATLADYEVEVLDASSKGLTLDQTVAEIEQRAPAILGLSVVTYRAWAMTQLLARTTAPIKVVGGPHTTHHAELVLRQGADTVFVGDAETAFRPWLEAGCRPGIVYGQPSDLDRVPFPDRNLVDLDDYRIAPNKDLLFDVGSLRLPMYSSKGCPYRCVYCDVQQKKFNGKQADTVVREFSSIVELGATSVHILDDCFNIRKERVLDICRKLKERGLERTDWSVRGSVEKSEEVMAALAEAGCRRYHVGIEHLDDGVLAFFRKSHRYAEVSEFCRLAKKYGIELLAYFIIGAPGETREYRQNLPRMISDLGIRYPFFNVLSPLSETDYYQGLLEDGTFASDHWASFVRQPVKDFAMPSARSDDADRELEACIENYLTLYQ